MRYESLRSKFSLILFADNLMIGYSKKLEKIIRESAFHKKIKHSGLKFKPGLALTGVRTTGPRSLKKYLFRADSSCTWRN